MHLHFHTQQFTMAAKLKMQSELFIPFSMSKHICHIEKVIAIHPFAIALSHPRRKMLPKKKAFTDPFTRTAFICTLSTM